METTKSTSQTPSLDELVSGALTQLKKLDYSRRSIRRYKYIWDKLIVFAEQHAFENKLTEKLIVTFIEHHHIKRAESS